MPPYSTVRPLADVTTTWRFLHGDALAGVIASSSVPWM